VSLFEPAAQILRRGKPHRPTAFGRLVEIQETEAGIVTTVGVVDGKADAPLLVPAVEQHCAVFGRAPRLVATDRAFYSIEGEQPDPHGGGVGPRRGRHDERDRRDGRGFCTAV
jgi:hypothetical protein